MKPIRIAIIGFGKIAADQHVPSIAGNPRFELVATSSRSGQGVEPVFSDWRELLEKVEGLEAVAITTPPSVRHEIARKCISRGLQVLMEKPPTATLSEVDDLACFAEAKGVTLFATWHARHNPAVTAAAKALAGKRISEMQIVWHEDVHKWHPGQQWIWEPGGFGVFDPGINAFSIATAIFPGELFVRSAELSFPENAQTPIAAEIEFASDVADGPLHCSLDWRRTEGEEWTITARTVDALEIRLTDGGSRLIVDGVEQKVRESGEYADIYREFADLVDDRRSSVDVRPLRLVADCFLASRRRIVEPVSL
ncbi:MAG TPA: Gfo/Idh/MocA family oxidoreductase [Sphingomicrobium sp.]|jgi:predicted dehydrogenase